MGRLSFNVNHGLSKEDALQRVKKLVERWGSKYGVTAQWNGS